jgi:GT2 family glycosyltransferase
LVSIVLVNRNCGDFVDVVLPTLAHQTYESIETLVIDNGSDDGSVAAIRSRYSTVRVIELGSNTGFSRALNVGIRESHGEYIFSLNFDVTLEAPFVAEIVNALQQRPEVGWAAGAMRKLTRNGIQNAIDCNGHYLLRSRYCYGYDPDHPEPSYYDRAREVFGASACAALYRRSMLESLAVGGEIFDEDLFAYFEDVDLDWRAQLLGYRCLFVPSARGAHMRGGSGPSVSPAITALLLANRLLVMLKNDEFRDVLHDLLPISTRTLIDVGMNLRRHPKAVFTAVVRLLGLAPRMLRKRRVIRPARVQRPSPVRRFRLATSFLG